MSSGGGQDWHAGNGGPSSDLVRDVPDAIGFTLGIVKVLIEDEDTDLTEQDLDRAMGAMLDWPRASDEFVDTLCRVVRAGVNYLRHVQDVDPVGVVMDERVVLALLGDDPVETVRDWYR